jgi:hypothetical protein
VGQVLSLYDAATQEVEPIRPGHPRQLKVLTVAPVLADPADPDLAQLRGWLLADQLRRTAERRSLVPTVCEVFAPGTTGAEPLAAEVRSALNFHPPARVAPAGEPVQATVEFAGGGPPAFDIGTGDTGWLAGLDVIRYHAATGTVDAGSDGPRRWSELTAAAIDPLALRVVLTRHRYREDAAVTWDLLAAAGQMLSIWRGLVAEWANSPSAAMPERYADAVTAAFDDDLDTTSAMAQLMGMIIEPAVAPGAKFETFAAADRLLGLDLARDVGRY